jgi:hypothetical protein
MDADDIASALHDVLLQSARCGQDALAVVAR